MGLKSVMPEVNAVNMRELIEPVDHRVRKAVVEALTEVLDATNVGRGYATCLVDERLSAAVAAELVRRGFGVASELDHGWVSLAVQW